MKVGSITHPLLTPRPPPLEKNTLKKPSFDDDTW